MPIACFLIRTSLLPFDIEFLSLHSRHGNPLNKIPLSEKEQQYGRNQRQHRPCHDIRPLCVIEALKRRQDELKRVLFRSVDVNKRSENIVISRQETKNSLRDQSRLR
jgi:hypothetical protein